MPVDFSANHFELFDLPVSFGIDESKLIQRFQSLQRELHPDRFASATGAEKRWSMQAASLVNEAYQNLTNPLARAGYLLELNGISIDEETDTQMDPMFLMQQMELREALGDATDAVDPFAALDTVRKTLNTGIDDSTARFENAANDNDWTSARTVVREWQFFDKLKREVRSIEARLDD